MLRSNRIIIILDRVMGNKQLIVEEVILMLYRLIVELVELIQELRVRIALATTQIPY